jgi:hypothetical protein
MPVNPATGKTVRKLLSEAELTEFRIKQTKEARAEIEKGKQPAGDPPDAGTPEDSGLVPSPLAGLSALGSLTLESGGSSAGNTPSDSPAVPSQPSAIEHPPEPLPPTPAGRRASKRRAGMSPFKLPATAPTQHSAALPPFVVEVPSTSQHLTAPDRRASHSPASNDGSNSARIAALETKQTELEKRQSELERKHDELAKFVRDFVRRPTNTGS